MKHRYPVILSEAFISEDRVHRYSLTRAWNTVNLFGNSNAMILFIGLNPSRADAVKNDATIRRCINFAQDWGYNGMFFCNLYSFRTPYVKGPLLPRDIARGWKPLIENLDIAHNALTDQYLQQLIDLSRTVVCCWGSWKFTKERERRVVEMIYEPMCFGENADGSPKHPLYLPNSAKLERYLK